MRIVSYWAITVCYVLLPASVDAGILWYTTATNRISYDSGGTNYLVGSQFDPSAGCFVQLIYAGPNNSNDIAWYEGDGTSNDDVVMATNWFGHNIFLSDRNGWFNNGVAASGITNGYFFVRAWSAASPNYAAGLVPTAPTNRYGDSFLWQYMGDGDPPQNQVFNFGGALGFSTTLAPIPEAPTLAAWLFGIGWLLAPVFGARLRRRFLLQRGIGTD